MGLTTNTPNLRPMYTSYLEEQIIKNPFYYGEMDFKGKLHPHKYDKLIPEWLWHKCQARFQNRKRYAKPESGGANHYAASSVPSCPG